MQEINTKQHESIYSRVRGTLNTPSLPKCLSRVFKAPLTNNNQQITFYIYLWEYAKCRKRRVWVLMQKCWRWCLGFLEFLPQIQAKKCNEMKRASQQWSWMKTFFDDNVWTCMESGEDMWKRDENKVRWWCLGEEKKSKLDEGEGWCGFGLEREEGEAFGVLGF